MPDDVGVLPSFEPAAVAVATDDVGGRHYQWMKQAWGADGTATALTDTNAGRLPVGGASLGNPDDAAAASESSTASLLALVKLLLGRTAKETVQTVAVSAGANLSAEIDLTGIRNWGFFVPSTFDGTQIEFHVSSTSGGTFNPLYDISNNIIRMTVTPSRWYDIPGELLWARYLKINCVTAQASTTTDFIIVGRG